jgi:hypothetical protein
MKRNTLNSLLLLVLISGLLACKTKKVLVKAPTVAEVSPVNNKKIENLKLLKAKDLPFTTLSLKGKVILDMNGNENNVNVNIRIKKDEKIWVSITAFAGIEVARALITPDSVQVRNNLQSLAVKKPFSYLNTFTSKQVTFKMLQSLVSGNTIDDFMTPEAKLDLAEGKFELSGDKGTLAYQVLFNTLLKPAELNLNDVKAGQALKVVYGDYQEVTGARYPSMLKINSVSGKKKTNLTFDFSKIERNLQLDFPFTVPNRFEIIN